MSLFEPHADIIVTGRAPHALRTQDQPEYRAQCAGARCGGTKTATLPIAPAACRCSSAMWRPYGEPPQRAAFDGGYASRENLDEAKKLGVEHVVFHKKSGTGVQTDMTPVGVDIRPAEALSGRAWKPAFRI